MKKEVRYAQRVYQKQSFNRSGYIVVGDDIGCKNSQLVSFFWGSFRDSFFQKQSFLGFFHSFFFSFTRSSLFLFSLAFRGGA